MRFLRTNRGWVCERHYLRNLGSRGHISLANPAERETSIDRKFNHIIDDGTFSFSHNGPELINAQKLPVSRIPRTDGVLQLRVQKSLSYFDVLIPLDREAVSCIRSTAEDGSEVEEAIDPRLCDFSGKPFLVPRRRGDTSIPEAISYDNPADPDIRCTICIYNDEALPNAPSDARPVSGADAIHLGRRGSQDA